MAEARMHAGVLMSLLANGNCDRRQIKRALAAFDPFARPRKRQPLKMADLKAFFVRPAPKMEDGSCEASAR